MSERDASQPKVCFVAPAFNEADNIRPFHEAVAEAMAALPNAWEIVLVDDGSSDATLATAHDLSAEDPRVRVVALSRNFGKEAALTAGLDHAGGDVVVPIDVDLQDPPELVADMLREWAKGADVVYATRTERHGESFLKKASAAGFYRLMGATSRVPIPPNAGDFRLIDRRVVDTLGELKETRRFMKGLFAWVGYNQVSLPFERPARRHGSSKWAYWKLWNFAIEGITSFSSAPLQLAMYFGFMVSFAAFGYAGYIVVRTLLFGVDVPGFPSLFVAILFFGGIQLISIGILGEYIGRIYDEVKHRPTYIVKDRRGFDDGDANG